MARKTPIRQDAIVSVFAQKLREIRHARGMTQRDLARVTHLAESYISRLENGTIAPGIDLVARLARTLGIPFEELFQKIETPTEAALAIAAEQAHHLLESILESRDPGYISLLVQMLALLSAGMERKR